MGARSWETEEKSFGALCGERRELGARESCGRGEFAGREKEVFGKGKESWGLTPGRGNTVFRRISEREKKVGGPRREKRGRFGAPCRERRRRQKKSSREDGCVHVETHSARRSRRTRRPTWSVRKESHLERARGDPPGACTRRPVWSAHMRPIWSVHMRPTWSVREGLQLEGARGDLTGACARRPTWSMHEETHLERARGEFQRTRLRPSHRRLEMSVG